ncbi:MAG TPA: DUF305 domain-containing protein [Pseudonocardiaceae bacterium]|jgi:uncharacterized protein (DUF305 family)|nr:DUF305 domain-containing protein [Pseudonocardiaceae bacterium]
MSIHRMATALVAAAAVGGLVAGCGGNTATSPSTTTAPAASNAPVASQQQHNQADVVFLQNMIPHHQQAVMMSQMALTHATTPQVKDLATRIQAAQQSEIEQMRRLLATWGIPANPSGIGPMGGMGPGQGPGMMSGTTYDRTFLQNMIVHHQSAIEMSQTELAQGSNPETRQLAEKIITSQQAEIKEMQGLLQRI